ncbi:type II toxin-antitoxin system RelE/ParE family toxin [Azospirillum argentinense]|uniref:Type II toxin-antitoxin system RelE/ParE family toxin n=1 Tax=Azospirillum argentinense TaxID=2970906 RepID=A0A4D8PJ10_9PROT|nr:type II toxin-antitoxin system RelE/ParE family toxin [Azospirillum argentinense]QCN94449.1 type II toxin-antitoxin system RelE/ParE family toxin [Azospirillum argentinense]
MQVQILAKAVKDLKALSPPDRARVLGKIEQYAADPTTQANNVKALQGSDLFRLRVGDYRVLFTVAADGTVTVMLVHRVRHRREAYD